MENITIELYIIAYTFFWLIILFLNSLIFRIILTPYRGLKKIFNNNKKWGIF